MKLFMQIYMKKVIAKLKDLMKSSMTRKSQKKILSAETNEEIICQK